MVASGWLRRVPDETIRDYVDQGLLRICQPAHYGGYDLGYDVLCEVTQTLSRGCGSQGWVHMDDDTTRYETQPPTLAWTAPKPAEAPP